MPGAIQLLKLLATLIDIYYQGEQPYHVGLKPLEAYFSRLEIMLLVMVKMALYRAEFGSTKNNKKAHPKNVQ